jgi:hypothetical protein
MIERLGRVVRASLDPDDATVLARVLRATSPAGWRAWT